MNRRHFIGATPVGAMALVGMARAGHAQPPPPPERKVLEGIERIGWGATACSCFVGATAACMRYLGEKVTDDYVMGISGGAFKILWEMPWSAANCDLLLMGEEPIRQTFAALGYEYTRVPRHDPGSPEDAKERLRQGIVASINDGRPVIASGVVGPPECCLVAGYDEGGEVLLGWSYFQEDPSAYFRTDAWSGQCEGLILIGDKKAAPPPDQALRGALEWAIELARTAEMERYAADGTRIERRLLSGFAAFDAFAEALERDEDFPPAEIEGWGWRIMPILNDGVYLLQCMRRCAARFVNTMADRGFSGSDELRKAAAGYLQEVEVWLEAVALVPWDCPDEEKPRKIGDPAVRRGLARLVRQAKSHDERAVGHLEQALGRLKA